MKKAISASLITVIIIFLFTISCNKNDISIVNSNNSASKEMLLSYLNQQKKIDLNDFVKKFKTLFKNELLKVLDTTTEVNTVIDNIKTQNQFIRTCTFRLASRFNSLSWRNIMVF